MKKLIFHKEDNSYIFEIIDNDDINMSFNNIFAIWDEFPTNIIYRLENTISELFSATSNAIWDYEKISLLKIRFFSDLLNTGNFDIFIPKIIENVNSIIKEHEID